MAVFGDLCSAMKENCIDSREKVCSQHNVNIDRKIENIVAYEIPSSLSNGYSNKVSKSKQR